MSVINIAMICAIIILFILIVILFTRKPDSGTDGSNCDCDEMWNGKAILKSLIVNFRDGIGTDRESLSKDRQSFYPIYFKSIGNTFPTRFRIMAEGQNNKDLDPENTTEGYFNTRSNIIGEIRVAGNHGLGPYHSIKHFTTSVYDADPSKSKTGSLGVFKESTDINGFAVYVRGGYIYQVLTDADDVEAPHSADPIVKYSSTYPGKVDADDVNTELIPADFINNASSNLTYVVSGYGKEVFSAGNYMSQ
jgi:hypothetical protein